MLLTMQLDPESTPAQSTKFLTGNWKLPVVNRPGIQTGALLSTDAIPSVASLLLSTAARLLLPSPGDARGQGTLVDVVLGDHHAR